MGGGARNGRIRPFRRHRPEMSPIPPEDHYEYPSMAKAVWIVMEADVSSSGLRPFTHELNPGIGIDYNELPLS